MVDKEREINHKSTKRWRLQFSIFIFLAIFNQIFNISLLDILGRDQLPTPNIFSGNFILYTLLSTLTILLAVSVVEINLKSIIYTEALISIYCFISSKSILPFGVFLLFVLSEIFIFKSKKNKRENEKSSKKRERKLYPAFKFNFIEREERVKKALILISIFAVIAPQLGIKEQIATVKRVSPEKILPNQFKLGSGWVDYQIKVIPFNDPKSKGELTYSGKFNWESCEESAKGVGKYTKDQIYGYKKIFYNYNKKIDKFISDKTRTQLNPPLFFLTQPIDSISSGEDLGLCNSLKKLSRYSYKSQLSTREEVYSLDKGFLDYMALYNARKIIEDIYKYKGSKYLNAIYNYKYQHDLDVNYNSYLKNYAYFQVEYISGDLSKIKLFMRDQTSPDIPPKLFEEITFKKSEIKIEESKEIKDLTDQSVKMGLF